MNKNKEKSAHKKENDQFKKKNIKHDPQAESARAVFEKSDEKSFK